MADGVILNAGSGGVTATTDDCGVSGHTQVVKLAISTDGSAVLIPAEATNGLDVDVTRVIPGVTATALGKQDGVAYAAGDVGVAAMGVRKDTAAVDAGVINGDYTALSMDSAGRLWVNASGAAVPVTDNGGTLTVDNAALSVTGGGVEATALRVTIASDSTGVVSVDDNGGSITVDGTVTANLAAGTNNIGDVDVLSIAAGDNNIGNVDIVTFPAEVHSADFDSGAGTDTTLAFGIAVPASGGAVVVPGDATAGLKVDLGADNDVTVTGTVTANLAAGTNNIGDVDVLSIAAGDNNIGNVDIVTMPNVTLAAGTNTNEVVGDAAHDAVVAGNPVLVGAYATNSIEGLTQVAAGDAARLVADLNGVLVTRPHTTPEETISERVADTGGTATAFTNFGAVASVRNFVTSVTIWNSSATDGYVDLRDGAAGSVIATIPAPQTGGAHCTFPVPLRTSANTALAYDVSGAISTVYITVVGYQAKG